MKTLNSKRSYENEKSYENTKAGYPVSDQTRYPANQNSVSGRIPDMEKGRISGAPLIIIRKSLVKEMIYCTHVKYIAVITTSLVKNIYVQR